MLFTVLTGASQAALPSNKAVDYQGQRMHDELLDITKLPDYQLVMSMPPGPAKRAAIQSLEEEAAFNEASVPEYWDTDKQPRRPTPLSSSWVPNIQYDPKTQNMTVHFGKLTKIYPLVDPATAAKILRGQIYVHKPNSIGSAMNKFWDERFGKDRPRGRAAKGI